MNSGEKLDNKNNKNSSRFLKRFLGIISVSIIASILIIYVFLDGFIKSRIIREVNNSSQGLYNLTIDQLDAKFWSGAIAMKDVWLRPDKTKLNTLKLKDSLASIPDVNLHFDSVNISTIRWIRYLLNKEKLEIGTVLIDRPDFIIHNDIRGETTIKIGEQNFLDLLPGIIAAFTGSLRIDAILVKDGHLHYDLHGKNGVVHQIADSVYIDLQKIIIDTLESNNALYSKKAFIQLNNYTLTSDDNRHKFIIKKIRGAIHDSTLMARDIFYLQKDSIDNSKDLMKIVVESVNSHGVDYGNLLKDKKIFLRSLVIQSPVVDLNASENPIEKYGNSKDSEEQQKSILDVVAPYISGAFRIDTLSVKNGAINYQILNDKIHIFQSANHINLDFSRVVVDTTFKKSDLYVENMNVSLQNYHLKKDKESELKVKFVKASVGDSILQLKDVAYVNLTNDLYKISAKSIVGDGIDYMLMLDKKKLNLNSLSIISPQIEIVSISKKTNSKKYSSSKDFFRTAMGPFSDASFVVRKLDIKKAAFKIKIQGTKDIIEQNIDNLNLKVFDIKIDSSIADLNKLYNYFEGDINGYQLKVFKDNIKLQIEDVAIDSRQKKLSADNFVLTQIKSFGPTQRFYFIDSIQAVSIKGFDFDKLLSKQEVFAEDVEVENMNLKITYDGDKDFKTNSVHRMPQGLFQRIKFNLDIDTVNFKNSSILYSGKSKDEQKPDLLSLDKFNAGISNLTNRSSKMSDSTPALIKGSAYVLGEGLLEFHMEMPLLSKQFNMHYGGVMGNMNGQKFNDLLHSEGIRVESGEILPSTFEVDVINGTAFGEIQFVYKDLHIEMFDLKDQEEKRKKFMSLLGNFTVKNSNPNHRGEHPEVVNVCARVTDEDSFFNFIWRILSDGITRTVVKDTIYKVKNEN
jgi:hypothetical protein